jgi:prepilin-type N-terminal cleavage/methylation domain-containing protein
MTRTPTRRAAGFTLLEVLISLAILGFMLVIAWGTIISTTKAKRHFEAVQERYRNVRAAEARIERDLSMAFLTENEDSTSVEKRSFFVGESSMSYDTVRFATLAHQRLMADANESEQAYIHYFTGPDPDDKQLTHLYRRETRRLANPNERWDTVPGDTDVLISGISKFKLSYWNLADKEWEETWSTLSADGKQGKLPDRVRITLAFEDERGQEVTFVTQTRVYMTEVLKGYAN